jgi:hypothetical protein
MFYIEICNKGEVDINAFCLLGASTKREDKSKIGFFGSGLKYAIAVLTRKGIGLKVYSGKKEIKITTEAVNFGGCPFNVINFNGIRTSLTTDMGPDWKTWFCLREIYCNAIDEGLVDEPRVVEKITKKDGVTKFYIELTEDVNAVFKNWNKFFSDKREDEIKVGVDRVKFFEGGKELLVYRKGIAVYLNKIPSLFHYDLENVAINESRIVEDEWNMKWDLVGCLKEYATVEMIERITNYITTCYRARKEPAAYELLNLDWDNSSGRFSDDWLKVLKGKTIIFKEFAGKYEEFINDLNTIVLPEKLITPLRKQFGTAIDVMGLGEGEAQKIVAQMTEEEEKRVEEAKKFLAPYISTNYLVRKCHFTKRQILGEAVRESLTVYIDEEAFNEREDLLRRVLLEEFAHLDSGYDDMTRALEDFCFRKMVEIIKKTQA